MYGTVDKNGKELKENGKELKENGGRGGSTVKKKSA